MLEDLRGVEGLEMRRTVPPIVAWALSIGCTVGWGSFAMPSNIFLPKAGPLGTAIAFLFGMLAMLIVAINYGYLAQRCPGNGGVYSYARDVFGPNHAFLCSWCLVLAYCSAMISNATALALVIRSVVGPLLQVGAHYVVAGYDVYLGEVLSGILIVVLTACILVRSAWLSGVIETLLAIGMVAGIALIGILGVASPAFRPETLTPAFSPDATPLAGTLMVVAWVPWAYIGFEAVSQVAGECSFSSKRFARVMSFAVICGTLMYLVLTLVIAAITPQSYASWVDHLEALATSGSSGALPSFAAAELIAGRAGILLFGFTALCAVLTGVLGFYAAASRLVYAMAVDGALSKRLARLHGRHHTPVVATLAIFLATILIPFLGRNVLTWIVDLMSLGALIAYLYTSLATMSYARREGSTVRLALGIAGTVLSLLCIALLVIPIPQLGTSLSNESYVILFMWVALGVNFFTPTLIRSE